MTDQVAAAFRRAVRAREAQQERRRAAHARAGRTPAPHGRWCPRCQEWVAVGHDQIELYGVRAGLEAIREERRNNADY